MKSTQTIRSILMAGALAVAPAAFSQDAIGHDGIKRVLLISIDGMHTLDYLNCSQGIVGVNNGSPYCPNLAALGSTGLNYLDATTSKPSDSFPGLMAIVSGGSPRTVGAFYDVAYDRSLNPPQNTTGNGVAGGPCTAGSTPSGTTTEYEEGIDLDQSKLNGGAPGATLTDGGIKSIDPTRLERDRMCKPVYPWNFVRTNTIFGVIHQAGGYTAWADKHPAYSSVSGPGDGSNVDDYYSPEINSTVINLPGVTTPLGMSCANIPDPSQTGAWTDSFQNIQCYDTLKVNAILRQINGKTHLGNASAPVPNLFGMNFQAVSVGEKLIEKNVGSGGYLDSIGTPSTYLLSEIQFVDASIGQMTNQLKKNGLLSSTLIVITAKHGQSPIDPKKFFPIPGSSGVNGMSPANILASMLPFSESPLNPAGIGPTEDDVSLIWLADSTQTAAAVAMLESNLTTAGIGEIFSGLSIGQWFNLPGLPPQGDPRTPDIVITPGFGVVYTGSSKKQAEHGGFSNDDTRVMLLLSNPALGNATNVQAPVQTAQVAPTILQVLGLDPNSLESVQKEGTKVLPGLK
ncbi:MAG: alkaline phosphatase family protein [Bryobacteraceae bacterium]